MATAPRREHEAKMAEIRGEVAKQDVIIGELSNGLDSLHATAKAIGDELELQNHMLTDIELHVDGAQGHMDTATNRTQQLRTQRNNTDKICIYLVCITVLIVVIIVLWQMIATSKK